MTDGTESTRRMFLKAIGVGAVASTALPTLRAIGAGGDSAAAFSPDIGVCTSVRNASILRAAGAAYIEASVRGFLVPDKPDDVFEEHLRQAEAAQLPIRCANGFLPGSLKCVGPKADHAAVLKFAEVAFRRAERLGVGTIVFGSSGARSIPDGFDRRRAELQFVALLAKMAPLAEAHGVMIAVEPLNSGETNFINTVPQGVELADPVQHSGIRLVADIYHMMRMEEPAQNIRDAAPFVRHVHIAEKAKRTAPGVAGNDFRPYLQALKDIGYGGLISIECRWSDLAAELPRAITTLREQMSDLS